MSMFSSIATESTCKEILNKIEDLEKEYDDKSTIIKELKDFINSIKKSAEMGYE